MKKRSPSDWILIILMIVLALTVIVLLILKPAPPSSYLPTPSRTPTVAEQIVHIDGYDASSDVIITPLNVWKDYNTRTLAFKIDHGAIVTMLKKTADGNGVYIRDASGREGWITYFFIKE